MFASRKRRHQPQHLTCIKAGGTKVPPAYFCRYTTNAAVATMRSPFELRRVLSSF